VATMLLLRDNRFSILPVREQISRIVLAGSVASAHRPSAKDASRSRHLAAGCRATRSRLRGAAEQPSRSTVRGRRAGCRQYTQPGFRRMVHHRNGNVGTIRMAPLMHVWMARCPAAGSQAIGLVRLLSRRVALVPISGRACARNRCQKNPEMKRPLRRRIGRDTLPDAINPLASADVRQCQVWLALGPPRTVGLWAPRPTFWATHAGAE
jgi:hypothetical protein